MMGGKIMRGKMFRPSGSDDEDGGKHLGDSSSDDSSSDEEDEQAPQQDSKLKEEEEEEEEDGKEKPAVTKRSRDSDDDDSDEDEEEEEEDTKNKKSKAKKRPKISFFDEEAEASDDDEDDSDRDPDDVVRKHYTEEDIRKEYRDEEAEAIIAQQDRRRQRAGGWLSGIGTLTDDKEKDDADVERIAKELEERHRMERRVVDRRRVGKYDMGDNVRRRGSAGEGGAEDVGVERGDDEGPSYTAVSQQSLVPSVTDPGLWMFSCPSGKEQELVYQIMNKCVAFAKRGKPLGITSVVVAQTKGKIYVESYSEPAVMEAVQGVRGLMQYTSVKVPIADMTTVMTVIPKKVPGTLHLAFSFETYCFT